MVTADTASDDMLCAIGTSDCGTLGELNYDGRNVQLYLKDAPTEMPVAIHSLEEMSAVAQSVDLACACPTRRPSPGSSSPLNVLYCVYLD